MDAYVYQGDLYCGQCNPEEAEGPVPLGGGEDDCPHHCVECGAFLGNPISDRGRRAICDLIVVFEREGVGDEDLLMEYQDFYDITEDEVYGSSNSSYQHLEDMEDLVT